MSDQKRIETGISEIYSEAQTVFAGINRKRDFGFKILNSPPIYRPRLLFIGYQPGGGLEDFEYEKKLGSHLTWPKVSEVATASWPLARNIRAMCEPAIDLRESVSVNANFLRSPTIADYNNNLSKPARDEVKHFCLIRTERIIDLIEPVRIVVIGFATLNLFGPSDADLKNHKGRILTRLGKVAGRDAISTLHLSGAHISNPDRASIAERIIDFCKE